MFAVEKSDFRDNFPLARSLNVTSVSPESSAVYIVESLHKLFDYFLMTELNVVLESWQLLIVSDDLSVIVVSHALRDCSTR